MFFTICSVVFDTVPPNAHDVNEFFPPFFFTDGFICFSIVTRLNFKVFLTYVSGELVQR